MRPTRDPADLWAITDLVARFDDAVNRRSAEEFRPLWAADAVWEIGAPLPMRVEGASAIVETWQSMIGATTWLFRGSFAGVVDIDGDTATGRWPCIETGEFKADRDYDNRAVYEDTYVRTPDGWRFKRRFYRYIWLSREDLPGAPQPG